MICNRHSRIIDMRRNSISFYLLSIVFLFASCLGDSEETTVYPSDAVITSFALGTLKQYVTTKAKDGSDSTYTKDVAGNTYKFYIDQVNHEIYNPDSLPYGTDVKHVLCNVTSKNSGTITIQKLNSDTLQYYTSTDTIDFTTKRTFRVFSLDGTNTQNYTVSVNVRQEYPDTLLWSNTATNPAFAEANAMKALSCNGKVFVVLENEQSSVSSIYSTNETSGTEWEHLLFNIARPLPADASQNIVSNGNCLYLYNANTIYRSTNGEDWEMTANAHLKRLVAASDNTLFALSGPGILVSSNDEGTTWTTELLDDNASLLPTQDLSTCEIYSRINKDTRTIKFIGNRDLATYPGDTHAQVWSKLVEGSDMSGKWMYTNPNDLPYLMLPRLNALQVTAVGARLLAAGCSDSQKKFYYSDDGGIYWYTKNSYDLPGQEAITGPFAMTTDSHGNIWMVFSDSGSVWRGHVTSDGKSKVPTAITE